MQLLCLFLVGLVAAAGQGKDSCKCIGGNGQKHDASGGLIQGKELNSGGTIVNSGKYYPAGYGERCSSHDEPSETDCTPACFEYKHRASCERAIFPCAADFKQARNKNPGCPADGTIDTEACAAGATTTTAGCECDTAGYCLAGPTDTALEADGSLGCKWNEQEEKCQPKKFEKGKAGCTWLDAEGRCEEDWVGEKWCDVEWCYVDPCLCDLEDLVQSSSFVDGYAYSYSAWCPDGYGSVDEIRTVGQDTFDPNTCYEKASFISVGDIWNNFAVEEVGPVPMFYSYATCGVSEDPYTFLMCEKIVKDLLVASSSATVADQRDACNANTRCLWDGTVCVVRSEQAIATANEINKLDLTRPLIAKAAATGDITYFGTEVAASVVHDWYTDLLDTYCTGVSPDNPTGDADGLATCIQRFLDERSFKHIACLYADTIVGYDSTTLCGTPPSGVSAEDHLDDCAPLKKTIVRWNGMLNRCESTGLQDARGRDSYECSAIYGGQSKADTDGGGANLYKDWHIQSKFRMGDPAPMNKCRCMGTNKQEGLEPRVGSATAGSILVQTTALGSYPGDYGAYCRVHDEPGVAACHEAHQYNWGGVDGWSGSNPAVSGTKAFCKQEWCYIDPCMCNVVAGAGLDASKSDYFLSASGDTSEILWYSYGACGGEDLYNLDKCQPGGTPINAPSTETAATKEDRKVYCENIQSGGRSICEWKECVTEAEITPTTGDSELCVNPKSGLSYADQTLICTLKKQDEAYVNEMKKQAKCEAPTVLGNPKCPCIGPGGNKQTADPVTGYISADAIAEVWAAQTAGKPWYMYRDHRVFADFEDPVVGKKYDNAGGLNIDAAAAGLSLVGAKRQCSSTDYCMAVYHNTAQGSNEPTVIMLAMNSKAATDTSGLQVAQVSEVGYTSHVIVPSSIKGETQKYDHDYGNTCGMHNEPAQAACYDLFPPSWCFNSWCYIDPCNCEDVKFVNSSGYFLTPTTEDPLSPKRENHYYSYETCGQEDTYSSVFVDGTDHTDGGALDQEHCRLNCPHNTSAIAGEGQTRVKETATHPGHNFYSDPKHLGNLTNTKCFEDAPTDLTVLTVILVLVFVCGGGGGGYVATQGGGDGGGGGGKEEDNAGGEEWPQEENA